MLENGYNPFYKPSIKEVEEKSLPITMLEAKERFEIYHKAKNTRPKSISSYLSKINQFISFVGEDKSVNDITDSDIVNYLQWYELNNKWTGVTYNFAKTALIISLNILCLISI